MTIDDYHAAVSFAAPWIDRPWPVVERPGLGHRCPNGKAVYIVGDYSGAVVYVGSTSRHSYGVRARMAEHMRDGDKTRGWSEVWTIPLRDDTPLTSVRRVEGLVGRFFRVATRLPQLPQST